MGADRTDGDAPHGAIRSLPPPPDEPDLVRAARRGDQDAYRSLVERYQERVFHAARRRLWDRDEARDVAQEAFVRAWEHLDTFDESRRFYTWVYRIAANLAIDRLRKGGSTVTVALDAVPEPPQDGNPSAPLEARETRDRVHTVLDRLPEIYRAALVARELENMTGADLAQALGTTETTARWRVHQARKLFREAWTRDARRRGLTDDARGET